MAATDSGGGTEQERCVRYTTICMLIVYLLWEVVEAKQRKRRKRKEKTKRNGIIRSEQHTEQFLCLLSFIVSWKNLFTTKTYICVYRNTQSGGRDGERFISSFHLCFVIISQFCCVFIIFIIFDSIVVLLSVRSLARSVLCFFFFLFSILWYSATSALADRHTSLSCASENRRIRMS